MSDIPSYRVLSDCFIEPIYFGEGHPNGIGSTIEYEGSPGPHLEPLNAAAVARMDAWYDEPFPSKDEKGKPILTKDGLPVFDYPHKGHRMTEYKPGERHSVRITAPPPKNDPGKNPLSLAEIQLRGTPEDTDQRPAPRVVKAVGASTIQTK